MKTVRIIGLIYSNIWIRNLVLACLIFSVIFLPSLFDKPKPDTKDISIYLALLFFFAHYALIFLHNHFLFRLFLQKKKYFFYLLMLLVYFVLFALFITTLRFLSGRPPVFFSDMIMGLIITIISLAVYIVNNWIVTNITETKKDLLQKNRELDFLKQQVSPHFLFNALNNLYGISLSSKELISDKLLELSDILRYQLEAAKKDVVPMEDEINFIQTYLNYSKDKIYNIEISNQFEGSYSNIYVPPLLFLPLIENAIKYTIETDRPFVNCYWTFDSENVCFRIENSFLSVGSKTKGTNIGIENVSNRLSLLKIKHNLKIDKTSEHIYKIELSLWNL